MPELLAGLEILGMLLNQLPKEQNGLLKGRHGGCRVPGVVQAVCQLLEVLGQSEAVARIPRRIRSHPFQVRENEVKFLAWPLRGVDPACIWATEEIICRSHNEQEVIAHCWKLRDERLSQVELPAIGISGLAPLSSGFQK